MAKQTVLNRLISSLNELNRYNLAVYDRIVLRIYAKTFITTIPLEVKYDNAKAQRIAFEVSEYLHHNVIGKELLGLLSSFNMKGSSTAIKLVTGVSAGIYVINQSGEAFLNVKIDLTKEELKQLLLEIDEIIK